MDMDMDTTDTDCNGNGHAYAGTEHECTWTAMNRDLDGHAQLHRIAHTNS